MLITRWQAPMTPSKELVKMMYSTEGLDPIEELYPPQTRINEHRHPFCEVRTVISGEMLFNIAGNQFLLRAGDRVEIPSNTKHWHLAQGNENCLCICANRQF